MSLIIFKYPCVDGWRSFTCVSRKDIRSWWFNAEDSDNKLACPELAWETTAEREQSWKLPLLPTPKACKKYKSKPADKVVKDIGYEIAKDFDFSAPDVDVTWEWDDDQVRWIRTEGRA